MVKLTDTSDFESDADRRAGLNPALAANKLLIYVLALKIQI